MHYFKVVGQNIFKMPKKILLYFICLIKHYCCSCLETIMSKVVLERLSICIIYNCTVYYVQNMLTRFSAKFPLYSLLCIPILNFQQASRANDPRNNRNNSIASYTYSLAYTIILIIFRLIICLIIFSDKMQQ